MLKKLYTIIIMRKLTFLVRVLLRREEIHLTSLTTLILSLHLSYSRLKAMQK